MRKFEYPCSQLFFYQWSDRLHDIRIFEYGIDNGLVIFFDTIDHIYADDGFDIIYGDPIHFYAKIHQCQTFTPDNFKKWDNHINSFSEHPSCLA